MLLPLLPQELHYCQEASSDDALLLLLIKHAKDLVTFFVAASDDETWTEDHRELMHKLIDWMTVQTLEGRLPMELAAIAGAQLRKHASVLNAMVSHDLLVKLKDTTVEVNSLLLMTLSDFFVALVREECVNKENMILSFPSVTREIFYPIHAYVNTGTIEELWKEGKEELIAILRQAVKWRIAGVATICQQTLEKFITDDNAIDMLLMAIDEQWELFKQCCVDFIDGRERGVHLAIPGPGFLEWEFKNFHDDTVFAFRRLAKHITHLSCHGHHASDPLFTEILDQCSSLVGLDLSDTHQMVNAVQQLPNTLLSLNLSQCPWLDKEGFKMLAKECPGLQELYLSSNNHLTFSAWGELADFKMLRKLDISRCHQMQDDDLIIILTGCPQLVELSLAGCQKLDDRGFFALSKNMPRLLELNLERCRISDAAVVELAMHIHSLRHLNLSRCELVTEKGVMAIVRYAKRLKALELAHNQFPNSTIEAMHQSNPQLSITTSVD